MFEKLRMEEKSAKQIWLAENGINIFSHFFLF